MDHFDLRDGVLHAEDVPLARDRRRGRHARLRLFARDARAPRARVPRGAGRCRATSHIAFAVKANPNLAVLTRARAARATAPTSSRAASWPARWRRACRPRTSSFRASARRAAELRRALDAGIGQFNLESEEEARDARRDRGRRGGTRADAALRVNPDVDAGTHAKISTGKAREQVRRADRPARRRSTRGSPRCPASRCAASRSISAAS